MDYAKLKKLLEAQETFPHEFILKFIGVNTPAFADDVRALELRHTGLRKQGERASSGGANLALTYIYTADDAEQIIVLLKEVSTIRDVRVIL